jgi:hypothetical protein
LSIIDIAGPFAYRFSDDSASGLPSDIKWSQIFAPGLHYNYGIKNSPLTINVGIQYS